MNYTGILTETHERVGLICLNRPQALNALNSTLLEELGQALKAFDHDEAIGCIVITGNDKAFAAGADIKDMAQASAADMLANGHIERFDLIRQIKKPVIAAVSGYCLGGGCEVALACDLIIASETAQFGQPEINIGVIPGAGGTQRLAHAVGKVRAMELVLTGQRISAQQAEAWGMVNRVVSLDRYLDEALELAREIASKAPWAARFAKESVNNAYETLLTEGLASERRLFYLLFATEDQKEGMQAFIEKRPAEWKGK